MSRHLQPKTHRRLRILCGLLLAGILYAEFAVDSDHAPIINRGKEFVFADNKVVETTFEDLVRTDPLTALMTARDRLVRESKDYSCLFVKQERIGSSMTAEQEIEVNFRPEPFSVMMHWVKNEGLADRVIYVKDRWVDETEKNPDLREQAVCKPGKGLALFIKSVKQPIHGSIAKKSSRRMIDEFGFRRAMDLLIKFCEIAKAKDELTIEFRGETTFDGRPVWMIRRRLPYSGEAGLYPDRIAEVYLDQEYHIPVAVYCYSDADAKPEHLLGKYEYRNIKFSIGLTDREFDPATYGM
jgi:hypothetical protein